MAYEVSPLRVGDIVSETHEDFYYLLGSGVIDIDGRVIFGEPQLAQEGKDETLSVASHGAVTSQET